MKVYLLMAESDDPNTSDCHISIFKTMERAEIDLKIFKADSDKWFYIEEEEVLE